jgi:octaprenyl-diphosphate synthase
MNSVASPAPSAKPAFAGVFAHLAPHMAELDRFLHGQLASFEPEIRAMADYCIDTSGKRIRPALVFLSGWRGAGMILPDLVRVAAVVELVHLATLVHDDIMDEADVRRSRRTASREFGPVAAVLLGIAINLVQSRRHPGFEANAYVSGRGPDSASEIGEIYTAEDLAADDTTTRQRTP